MISELQRLFPCTIRTAPPLHHRLWPPTRPFLQLDRSRLQLRDVEDLADDLQQMPPGVQDVVGEFPVLAVARPGRRSP